jgi:hypothetical protein
MTDLREKLRGVGRLDVMQDATRRAQAYYTVQGDIARLPEESQLRYAHILHARGEDYGEKGQPTEARRAFDDAYRVTSGLLADSADTARIYAHAQSEYWLGNTAWNDDEFAAARRHFERYQQLARQLIATDPRNRKWLLEAGYAESNLGTLALRVDKHPELAQAAFKRALQHFEVALKLAPGDAKALREMADLHGWLADSARELGNFREAYAERLSERRLLDALAAADPKNAKLKRDLVGSSVGLARLEASLGRDAEAVARLRAAMATIDALALQDPEDQAVAHQQATVTVRLASSLQRISRPKPADHAVIDAALKHCAASGGKAWTQNQRRLCDEIRSRESRVSIQ